MKKLLLFTLFALIIACSSVPIIGRRRIDLIPDSTMNSMSFSEYRKFLSTHKLSNNSSQVNMVKRVGNRIKKAVEIYMAEKGMSKALKGFRWEFNLVESSDVNAWAMPGGKVVFYTGILPYTQSEEGLAVVMGHEIAHVVAKHGNERMSQGLLTQLGGTALTVALAKEPEKTKKLWMTAFGLGAQYGALLPYSRLHENEADYLGLIFMAKAGYNPSAAVSFWQRMAKLSKGSSVPEFMSTHPASTTRIKNIRKKLPEAMGYYKNAHR